MRLRHTMRTTLLGFLAGLVQIVAEANDLPPIPNSPEDKSVATLSDTSSEGYAAPKAPPPTEVTRAFATREDGEGPIDVAQPDLLNQRLYTKFPPALWDAKAALEIESALLRQARDQPSRGSDEKAIQYTGIALFMLAFVGMSLLLLSDFNGGLTSPDTFFPPTLQPDEVERALTDLVTDNKVVVLLSDDCPTCLEGLKDLERLAEKPVALVLTGHRLDQVIRKHLEGRYVISRLPVVFINGDPFAGFASAVQSLKKRQDSPEATEDAGRTK